MTTSIQLTQGAGNARALTQLTECDDLFATYTAQTAAEIVARACNLGGFQDVKPEHIQPAMELIRALRSPNVDVRAERDSVVGKAKVAVADMLWMIELDSSVDEVV